MPFWYYCCLWGSQNVSPVAASNVLLIGLFVLLIWERNHSCPLFGVLLHSSSCIGYLDRTSVVMKHAAFLCYKQQLLRSALFRCALLFLLLDFHTAASRFRVITLQSHIPPYM